MKPKPKPLGFDKLVPTDKQREDLKPGFRFGEDCEHRWGYACLECGIAAEGGPDDAALADLRERALEACVETGRELTAEHGSGALVENIVAYVLKHAMKKIRALPLRREP